MGTRGGGGAPKAVREQARDAMRVHACMRVRACACACVVYIYVGRRYLRAPLHAAECERAGMRSSTRVCAARSNPSANISSSSSPGRHATPRICMPLSILAVKPQL